jgi:hypothetical protein
MVTRETVAELMLRVWSHQACQVNPSDWPRVLRGLFSDASSSRDNSPARASYKPRLDQAVDTITAALANGIPDDLEQIIWKSFAMLDREHRQQLARELLEAAVPAEKGLFDDLA